MFFCHQCQNYMEPRELQCSICDSEFIEEVEEQPGLDDMANPFLGLFGAVPGEIPSQNPNNPSTNLQQQMIVDLLSLLSNIPARNGVDEHGRGGVRIGDYVFGNLDDILEQLVDTPQQRGISDEEIAQLERVEVEGECPVCQEEYTKVNEAGDSEAKMAEQIRLPCKHVFHGECITKWLKVNGTCPVCRFSLLKEDTESSNQPNDAPNDEQARAHQARELEDRANRFISRMFVPHPPRETGVSVSDQSPERRQRETEPNPPIPIPAGLDQFLNTFLGGVQSSNVHGTTTQSSNPFASMFDTLNSGTGQTQFQTFTSPNGFVFMSSSMSSNRQSSDAQRGNNRPNQSPSNEPSNPNRETLYDPDVD
jgi:hypothetical protein